MLGIVAIVVLAPPTGGEIITSAEYGNRWPLTVESGTVQCRGPGAVLFRTGDKTYAINGLALSSTDYPPVDAIWRGDPDNPYDLGLKIDLSPIFERGLALCP